MTTSKAKRKSPAIQPNLPFLCRHPAHFLSFGFGSGLSPKAPGTAGTLVAFPIYWFLSSHISDITMLILIIAAFFIGIRACEITGKALQVDDYGGIVWDEIVAFVLVLFFTPAGWQWAVLAFVLFRFFDIVKPQPIQYYDQHCPGGLGVMLDDIIAAGYTILTLAIIKSVL